MTEEEKFPEEKRAAVGDLITGFNGLLEFVEAKHGMDLEFPEIATALSSLLAQTFACIEQDEFRKNAVNLFLQVFPKGVEDAVCEDAKREANGEVKQ